MSSSIFFILGTFLALFILSNCATSASPVCLAGRALDGEQQCRGKEAPIHSIPFAFGYSTTVTQGFHGQYTHQKDEAFAVDFSCNSGDRIAASKSGKVLSVKEDSNTGCSDASCIDMANYIVIDHGDGTFSGYAHLQHFGVLVEVGDDVCVGDIIGLCGNTGFSRGSHLHFSVFDQTQRTLPVQFAEPRSQRGFGFAIPDAQYLSQNRRQSQCKKVKYSPLSPSAFAHQGIILDSSLPVHFSKEAKIISGRYYGDLPYIAVHLLRAGESDWKQSCYPVKDTYFEALIEWDTVEDANYFLMLSGANRYCVHPGSGWSWAYLIRFISAH